MGYERLRELCNVVGLPAMGTVKAREQIEIKNVFASRVSVSQQV
jgi:hypothetical protein